MGGEAPHLLNWFPGPPGPARPQNSAISGCGEGVFFIGFRDYSGLSGLTKATTKHQRTMRRSRTLEGPVYQSDENVCWRPLSSPYTLCYAAMRDRHRPIMLRFVLATCVLRIVAADQDGRMLKTVKQEEPKLEDSASRHKEAMKHLTHPGRSKREADALLQLPDTHSKEDRAKYWERQRKRREQHEEPDALHDEEHYRRLEGDDEGSYARRLETHEGVPTNIMAKNATIEAEWQTDFNILKPILAARGYVVNSSSRLCELPRVYCDYGYRRRVSEYASQLMGDWVGSEYILMLEILDGDRENIINPELFDLQRLGFLQVKVNGGTMPPGIEKLQHASVLSFDGDGIGGGLHGGLPSGFWNFKARMFGLQIHPATFTGRLEASLPFCDHLDFRIYVYELKGFTGDISGLAACKRVKDMFRFYDVPLLTGNHWEVMLAWGHPVRRHSFELSGLVGPVPGTRDAWQAWCLTAPAGMMISSNQDVLGSTLPPGLEACGAKMKNFQVSGCNFTGNVNLNFPKSLGMDSVGIRLDGNRFSGPLPEVPPQTTDLYIQGNSWVGDIPASWYNAPGLKYIDLSYCNMKGTMPSVTPFTEVINLAGNHFHGPVPESWRYAKLKTIDLSYNDITGPIFSWGLQGVNPQMPHNGDSLAAVFVPPPQWPLKSLSLKGNPIGISVGFLLGMLGYYELESLDLSSCSLNGIVTLNSFRGKVPQATGGLLEFAGPRFSRLKKLDLSNNDIINFGWEDSAGSPASCWGESWAMPAMEELSFNDCTKLEKLHPRVYGIKNVYIRGTTLLQVPPINPNRSVCNTVFQTEAAGCPSIPEHACLYLVATYTKISPEMECADLGTILDGGARPAVSLTPELLPLGALCRCLAGFGNFSGSCAQCTPGTYRSAADTRGVCKACPANSATLDLSTGLELGGASECICLPGYYRSQAFTEQQSCSPCPQDTCRQGFGAVSVNDCPACPTGTYAKKGSAACLPCPDGQTSAGAGRGCICGLGFYNNISAGLAACVKCPGGMSTAVTRMVSVIVTAKDCECPVGTWFHAASPTAEGRCVSTYCDAALECPGGNAPPIQGQGFHAGRPSYENGAPSFVVTCANRDNCPGGRALGVCPAHRDVLACDLCEVGYFDDGQGRCTPCSESAGPLPLALTLTVAGIVTPFHCFLLLRPAGMWSESSSTVALTVTLAVNALQVLNGISNVVVGWIEPMASLKQGLKWLSFDVKVLQLQCASGTNAPHVVYLLGLLVFPVYAVFVWLFLSVAQACGRRQVTFNDKVNAVGIAMFALCTGLCEQCSRAWQCEVNPDGTASVASSRSLLCHTSDGHRTMLGISAAGALAYLVAPLALVLWVVFKYPYQIGKVGGLTFFGRYRFLIGRFRPERYWYCALYITRSILCALLPALLVNEPPLQFMLFILLIAGTLIIQVRTYPWNTTTANHLDAGMNLGLLWFIGTGCILLPTPDQSGQEMLQRCMMTVCVSFLIAVGSIVVRTLIKKLFPQKFYGVFLSHHKGAAAVLSRWCKLMFQAQTNAIIFLDSDELNDLNLLFNVVAWETLNFVLLWTSQTVLRPWCAGEIVSAWARKVHTVVVLCEQVPKLTDEFIQQVGSTWSPPEIKCLCGLGITIEKIRESYTALRSLPTMMFDRAQGEAAQEANFSLMFQACRGLAFASSLAMKLTSFSIGKKQTVVGGIGGIAIVGDTHNVETITVCYVLRIMLQKRMRVAIDVIGETLQQTEQKLSVANHLLVVLTKGCLKAQSVAMCVVKSLAYSELTTLPVNADKTFEFPGEDFWNALNVNFPGIDNKDLVTAYKSMLKLIAIILSPHASERILDAEVLQMVNCITDAKTVGAGKASITTPMAIDDQAIQAAPPATGSAPQPVVVGADTEDCEYST